MKSKQIDKDELIARCLYDPSFYHEGQLASRAFELINYVDKNGNVQHEKYISVLRESMCDIKKTSNKMPHREGEIIVGYASLKVEDVISITSPLKDHSIEVNVKSCPSPNLPSHAGIFTKIDNCNIKGKPINGHTSPLVSYVQAQLVKKSKVCLF